MFLRTPLTTTLSISWRDDVGDSHIRKALDALKRYFRWKGMEWDPENDVRESLSPPKDRKLKPKERRLVKSAALEYGFLDDVDGLEEDERDKYAARIAEHLGKPKSEVERKDWDAMESWKIPSLVYTSADAALRPKEIRSFTMHQIMWEDNDLRFDASDSTTKDELYWEIPVSDETMMVLRKWRHERAEMEKYDDTDLVWLNRENNPYTSNRLCGLLKTLLRMRGVDPDDTSRKLTWYSIRHSCGSRLVKEADYEVGQQVLRTTSETIRKYNIKDKEELRNAVESLE